MYCLYEQDFLKWNPIFSSMYHNLYNEEIRLEAKWCIVKFGDSMSTAAFLISRER